MIKPEYMRGFVVNIKDGRKEEKILLVSIIVFGCLLRIIGTDWGFPFLLHPDEYRIVDNAFGLIKNKTIDPYFYNWPGHVSIYITAIAYIMATLVKFKISIINTFESNMTFYYLVARLIVAILGSLSIFIAYLVGKEYERRVGIITAFLFAFFPSYIIHAHYSTPEIPLTLCMLFIILFAIKYLKNPTTRYVLLMCLFAALATAEKYPGILSTLLIAAVIILAHYHSIKTTVSLLVKAGLMFAAFLFLCAPSLYIRAPQIYRILRYEARSTHLGADALGFWGNLAFYAKMYFSFTGYILLFFFIIGTVYVIKRHKILSVPIFWGILYWIALSQVPLHWERWTVPMYISPLFLTACGIFIVYERIRSHPRRIFMVGFCVVFGISIINLILQSIVTTGVFTLKDTRYIAYEFCEMKGIYENETIYEKYTPFAPNRHIDFNLIFQQFENRMNINKKYIILSSYIYERFFKEKNRYIYQTETYQKIFALPLIQEFQPTPLPLPLHSSHPVTWTSEMRRIAGCLNFLTKYLTNKEDMSTGPIIKIYQILPGG